MNKLQNLVGSVWGNMLALLTVFLLVACSAVPVAQVEEKRMEAPIVSVEALPYLKLDPIAPTVTSLDLVVQVPPPPQVDAASLECLAKTIYFEARGESVRGQTAVGYVIVNRTNDPRFPSTVCGVVHQKNPTKGKKVAYSCQFHWYCDGLPDTIKDQKAYSKILDVARSVLESAVSNPVGKSLYFHASYVQQQKKSYAIRYKVGNHIFYT